MKKLTLLDFPRHAELEPGSLKYLLPLSIKFAASKQ